MSLEGQGRLKAQTSQLGKQCPGELSTSLGLSTQRLRPREKQLPGAHYCGGSRGYAVLRLEKRVEVVVIIRPSHQSSGKAKGKNQEWSTQEAERCRPAGLLVVTSVVWMRL